MERVLEEAFGVKRRLGWLVTWQATRTGWGCSPLAFIVFIVIVIAMGAAFLLLLAFLLVRREKLPASLFGGERPGDGSSSSVSVRQQRRRFVDSCHVGPVEFLPKSNFG